MSGGGPNNANRSARSGTLGAAISVLLLFFLDTNATLRSTKRITDANNIILQRSQHNAGLAPSDAGSRNRTPSGRRKARSCVVVGYFASPPSASSARLKRLFQSGRRMV
jgi:hypothetical protein